MTFLHNSIRMVPQYLFLLLFFLVAPVLIVGAEEPMNPEFEGILEDRADELRLDFLLSSQVQNLPWHQQSAVYDAVALSTTTPPDLSQQVSTVEGILIGPRSGTPVSSDCDGRSHYGQLSHQEGNSFCYGPAPQGYKALIDPYLCLNMDQFFRSCPVFGNGIVGTTCGSTSGATWGPPGKPSTSAWGTWTSWWKGLSEVCMNGGYWEDSDASRLPDVNSTANITFTIAGEAGDKVYESKELRNDSSMISVEGDFETTTGNGRRTLTSPTFNSPFIYLKNQLGAAVVKISSAWGQYRNQSPAFNQKDGWLTEVGDKTPLFYELGLTQLELSRNGLNFETKSGLIDFLKDGDFFDQLGFSGEEKQNSLGYLLPKLPEAPFYYLSILTPEAVANLSKTEITPAPDTFVRRYFAVYPTSTPVLAEGGLEYPSIIADAGFTARDYGEIIITPDMFVLWQ